MRLLEIAVCCLIVLHGSSSSPGFQGLPGGNIIEAHPNTAATRSIPRTDNGKSSLVTSESPNKAEVSQSITKPETVVNTTDKAGIIYKYESYPRSRFTYIQKIQKLPEPEPEPELEADRKQVTHRRRHSAVEEENDSEENDEEDVSEEIDEGDGNEYEKNRKKEENDSEETDEGHIKTSVYSKKSARSNKETSSSSSKKKSINYHRGLQENKYEQDITSQEHLEQNAKAINSIKTSSKTENIDETEEESKRKKLARASTIGEEIYTLKEQKKSKYSHIEKINKKKKWQSHIETGTGRTSSITNKENKQFDDVHDHINTHLTTAEGANGEVVSETEERDLEEEEVKNAEHAVKKTSQLANQQGYEEIAKMVIKDAVPMLILQAPLRVVKIFKRKGDKLYTQSGSVPDLLNTETIDLHRNSQSTLDTVRLDEKRNAIWGIPVTKAAGKSEYLFMANGEELPLVPVVDSRGHIDDQYAFVDDWGQNLNLPTRASEGLLSLVGTGYREGRHSAGFIGYDERGKYILPIHLEDSDYMEAENGDDRYQYAIDVHPAYDMFSNVYRYIK